MSPTKILTTTLVLLLIASTRSNAQCRTPQPYTACTGSEPLVVADEIIPDGITKWYYGPTTTMNSLTLRGGKLIVCGDLTIDKFYMDSGQIVINPSARFVVGSGIGAGLQLFGKCSITNYGTFECQRNLSMDNGWASPTKPNEVINATWASIFKMPNQYFVINNANSWFVNNGYAQFWGLITDAQATPGSVCLNGSTMHMAVLINRIANNYVVPSGNACVYVHQFSQFFGRLTNATNLYACLGNSHSSDAGCIAHGCLPNNWGNAQVVTNCNTCGSLDVLSVRDRNTFTSTRNEVKDIKLFPSPFIHYFFIESPGNNAVEKIVVSDITGKTIPVHYVREGRKWKVTVDDAAPRQVLVVQVVSAKGVVTRKVVKE